tara:strand:+ start:411 stop:752 length:342 start_codon:yes stop_codon:yes gene_type:complete
MTTKAIKPKKVKINIMGEKFKVDPKVNDALKALSEALHAHEVALLTWVHKDYNGTEKTDIKGFRESLFDYCLKIPEAGMILTRMKEMDEQYEKEQAEKEKSKDKKEEETGAKE